MKRPRRLVPSALILVLLAAAPIQARAQGSVEEAGDVLRYVIPATGLGATLVLADWQGTAQFALSMGANLGATYVLKTVVGRERPDGSNSRSFPSGHTSVAFQGAGFVHFRYGIRYALPLYAAAGFVGYSRIEAGKHYLGDVLAGAALGVLSAWLVVRPYQGGTVSLTRGAGGGVGLAVRLNVGF